MQNEQNTIFYLPLRIVLLIYSVFVGYYLPSWEGMSSCRVVWASKTESICYFVNFISNSPIFNQSGWFHSQVIIMRFRISSIKIWDFLQQYPTYGENGNIYTDYLTNWGSIILLVHFITGRSPRTRISCRTCHMA